MDDLDEIIIKLLEDHGYSSQELLDKLDLIKQTYQNKHIKIWKIENSEQFSILKDTIWFNFEYKINFKDDELLGLHKFQFFGDKYPSILYAGEGQMIIPYLYLNHLLEELNDVIKVWKQDKDIYLAEIYTDNIEIELNTPIIIHKKGEHPSKYCSDCIERTLPLLDSKGNMQKIDKKNYTYCVLNGKLNEYEQSNIYFNMLIDFRDNVSSAIQYHKDLQIKL